MTAQMQSILRNKQMLDDFYKTVTGEVSPFAIDPSEVSALEDFEAETDECLIDAFEEYDYQKGKKVTN